MSDPDAYDLTQSVPGPQARKLLSSILANGIVTIAPHAKAAASDDGRAEVDIWNVLRWGHIFEPGEWNEAWSQWRYRFHTARFCAVVAFEEISSWVVVTFWGKKGGR